MTYVSSNDVPKSDPQTMSERLRLIASRPEFDGMQEEATARSVRRTLRPRTLVLVGVAGGFAAAMGVSAMAAFLFFVLVPDQVNAMAPDLAASEHLTLGSAGAAKTTPEEARALLEKFVQWQQRQ